VKEVLDAVVTQLEAAVPVANHITVKRPRSENRGQWSAIRGQR